MDGCVVEGQGMVAGGALLTPGKRVRKGELWAGSPARLMRQVSEAELEYLAYSVRHYVELATAYRRQGG
jgi:gamma-carbonic anhydrase